MTSYPRTVFVTLLLMIAFGTVLPGMASAAEPIVPPRRHTAADPLQRLRESMTTSTDVRLRLLFSTRTALVDESDIGEGIRTVVLIPTAVLNEQARGSTDPLLLHLLLGRCGDPRPPAGSCDGLDVARRWTEADTQNQVAWLSLASVQHERGDEAAAHASVVRAAQASVWHEQKWDVARLIADAAPPTLSTADRVTWYLEALNKAIAIPMEPFSLLTAYCKEGGSMRDACARIAATMIRDGDSLITLILAPNIAARAQAPDDLVAGYRQKAYAIYWAAINQRPDWIDRTDDFADLDDDRAREASVYLKRAVMQSDRRRGEQFLIERHVSDADAAARYSASMSVEARQSRDRMLKDARAAGAADAGSPRSPTASP